MVFFFRLCLRVRSIDIYLINYIPVCNQRIRIIFNIYATPRVLIILYTYIYLELYKFKKKLHNILYNRSKFVRFVLRTIFNIITIKKIYSTIITS